MKPADAKAPKFDGKWWKANKAKAADGSGEFEKALTKYQVEKKKFIDQAKVGASHEEELVKALMMVRTVAMKAKDDKKLGVTDKDTKDALVNYAKQADTALGEIKRFAGSPIVTSSSAVLIKNGLPMFKAYCTNPKVGGAESYNFLSLMAKNPKKEKRWYEAFIKRGAKFEVNIPNAMRAPFDKIAADVKAGTSEDTPATWGAAPWDAVVREVTKLLDNDLMKRWRFYAAGAHLGPKLP